MNALSECQEAERESVALPLAGAFGWVARVADGIGRAYAGRRVLRQLARSDDRMLKDIGLDRSDLRSAAAEPLYRDPTELLAGHVNESRPRRRARNRALIAVLSSDKRRTASRS
jgi:uncharacterized protein YjiS (DUF1127 family)